MFNRRRKTSTPKEATAKKETPAVEESKPTVEEMLTGAGIKKTDRILQVGCADGTVSLELARIAGYVTVVERSVDLLAKAQEKVLETGTSNLSIQRIDEGSLPFESGIFDAIVSWGRINQEEDPAPTVKEMVRVLKSTGRLIVAAILGADNEAKREVHAKIEQTGTQFPIVLYTASGLRALLRNDALEINSQSQWTERVDFDDWMPEEGTDVSHREKTVRLLASAAKKQSTELDIEVAGKSITFKRRWMLIVAQKTGMV